MKTTTITIRNGATNQVPVTTNTYKVTHTITVSNGAANTVTISETIKTRSLKIAIIKYGP
jgi:hypothetical protein